MEKQNLMFIVLLLAFNSIAQNTIEGVVFYNNVEKEGIDVYYLNNAFTKTITNEFGEFKIHKQNNNDTIVIKQTSFVPVYITVKTLITDPEITIIKELLELPEVLQKEKETGIKEIPKKKIIDYLASGDYVYISKWHFSSTTFNVYKDNIIAYHEYNGVKQIYKDKLGNIYLNLGDLFYKSKFENGQLQNLGAYKKKDFTKLLAENQIRYENRFFKLIANKNQIHLLKQNTHKKIPDTIYSDLKPALKIKPKGKDIVDATSNNYFLHIHNDTIFLFDNIKNKAISFSVNGDLLNVQNLLPSYSLEHLKHIAFDDVFLQLYYIFENKHELVLQRLNCSNLTFSNITSINKIAEKPMVHNGILYYLISNYEKGTRKLIKYNLKK